MAELWIMFLYIAEFCDSLKLAGIIEQLKKNQKPSSNEKRVLQLIDLVLHVLAVKEKGENRKRL